MPDGAKRKKRLTKPFPDVPDARRRTMSTIRGANTKPEIAVRQLAHALGYRFRLHRCDLPGRPDLAFPKRKKVVFVHGCFWHQHPGCRSAKLPKTREGYWHPKLARNVARDLGTQADLRRAGWDSLVVWECELADRNAVGARLQAFLGQPGSTAALPRQHGAGV